MKTLVPLGLLAATMLLNAQSADAQRTRYTYAGTPFTNFVACYSPWSCGAPIPNYPPGSALTGFIDFATPLAANTSFTSFTQHNNLVDFSFSAGLLTVTRATATLWGVALATDDMGGVYGWTLSFINNPSVSDSGFVMSSSFDYSVPGRGTDQSEYVQCALGFGCLESQMFQTYHAMAGNQDAPGTWTQTQVVSTPEPSSLILLASGFVGLAIRSRLRRRA